MSRPLCLYSGAALRRVFPSVAAAVLALLAAPGVAIGHGLFSPLPSCYFPEFDSWWTPLRGAAAGALSAFLQRVALQRAFLAALAVSAVAGMGYLCQRRAVRRSREDHSSTNAQLWETNCTLLQELGRHSLHVRELQGAQRFLQAILDAMKEPVLVIDKERRVVAMNQAAWEFSGVSATEELYCYKVLHGLDAPCPEHDAECFCGVAAVGNARAASATGEREKVLPDGTRRWYQITATSIEAGAGKRHYVLETVHDITSLKEAEESAKILADFDPLTGLPNRRLFNDRLTRALAKAFRHKEKMALLFLDLDRFKGINDSLGHAVGDLMLQEVAKRLKLCCRREDDTIARQGGDEFIIILTEIADASGAAKIAQDIVVALREPFHLEGHELFISVSIGISVFPEDGVTPEALLANADTALYFAKEHGRNSYKIFNTQLNNRAMERLRLENSIHRALKQQEFVLHYQPKVNVKSGRVVCLEALLRWEHPELGLLLPSEFLKVAEDTGAIMPLGEWVLRTACSQNRAWQEEGHPAVRVAVNLSERQFRKPDLVEMVAAVLTETGLEARWLDLELDFSQLLRSAEEAMDNLKQLAAMGVHISVANFGKGFTSVTFLKALPVHALKIDRSCIGEVERHPEFATAFINMARSIGIEVIHEGVETIDQLDFFRSIACDELQGYLFSKPLPPQEVAEVLDNVTIPSISLPSGEQWQSPVEQA